MPVQICRVFGVRSTGICSGKVDRILKQCFVSDPRYNFETGRKLYIHSQGRIQVWLRGGGEFQLAELMYILCEIKICIW